MGESGVSAADTADGREGAWKNKGVFERPDPLTEAIISPSRRSRSSRRLRATRSMVIDKIPSKKGTQVVCRICIRGELVSLVFKSALNLTSVVGNLVHWICSERSVWRRAGKIVRSHNADDCRLTRLLGCWASETKGRS